MAAYVFSNCQLLKHSELIPYSELWVANGVVVSPPCSEAEAAKFVRVDCQNRIVAPGFIDIQLNGVFGADFTCHDGDSPVYDAARRVVRWGCTAFVATIITAEESVYLKRIEQIRFRAGNRADGATVLGVHLEGPFLSENKRGCHPRELIKPLSNLASLTEVYGEDLKDVVMVTLAPEQPGAMEAIEFLTKQNGVVVSLGHSEADYDTGNRALRAGASSLTHLFSAMRPFTHREPGLPGLVCSAVTEGPPRPSRALRRLLAERCVAPPEPQPVPETPIYFGLIADGVHSHRATLRLAFRLESRGLCLITDGIAALGEPPGNCAIGDTLIEVRPPADPADPDSPCSAYKQGTETLAGAVASIDQAVRRLWRSTGCSRAYALNAASLHPARALGIETVKGHLGVGADADFVILDEGLRVRETWVRGQCAFRMDPETASTTTS